VRVGDLAQPLEFRKLSGDLPAARKALLELATAAIAEPIPPNAFESETSPPAIDWDSLPPPVATSEHGQVYQLPGGLPMVAAYSPSRRLIFYGLALPGDENEWSLYALRPLESIAPAAEFPPLSLPPGARRVLSLASGSRSGTIVFSTPDTPEDMMGYYRRWCDGSPAWQAARD
jgi:hypothetical protein